MTSTSSTLRRLAVVVGSATLLLMTYAGPASADIPVGWSDPKPVPVLHQLLFLLGVPVLITLVILAAIYLPGIVRGESVAPAGVRTDDQWFGGRRDTAELQAAGADREASGGDRETGGASGSW
ncbi:hypothetical protein [Nocardioides cynanchi]|uniref:hypothetical protein n=1 Tax=Nocardioides cynanchi TaxID=2558918 RepID=UPI001246238D|nr:hypothetical protein [Nocardioides cynanchi]